MNAERKISRARVELMFSFPFIGYLAINLETREKKDLVPPTMSTDGKHLNYHPDFVDRLPVEQVMGSLAHEVYHCIFLHPARRAGRDPLKWNFACDYVDNAHVMQDKDKHGNPLELPPGILYDKKYDGMTAEEVYARLPDSPRGQTLDSHEEWAEWGQNGDDDTAGGESGQPSEAQVDSMEATWRERVAQAANQARMQGNLPGHLADLVDTILQPKLDWKTILRDLITSSFKTDFRLLPPNRKHLWRGLYMPSMYGEEVNIAYVLDTSGSISADEAEMELAELKGICNSFGNYTIYVMLCDAAVHQEFKLTAYEPIPKLEFRRGGTSFIPPIEKATREMLPISCLVYATDLYGDFPAEPDFPVIWLTFTDVKPPFGQVIRIPDTERRP